MDNLKSFKVTLDDSNMEKLPAALKKYRSIMTAWQNYARLLYVMASTVCSYSHSKYRNIKLLSHAGHRIRTLSQLRRKTSPCSSQRTA